MIPIYIYIYILYSNLKMEEQIRYKNLSWPLKISVVGGFSIALYGLILILALFLGFVIGYGG